MSLRWTVILLALALMLAGGVYYYWVTSQTNAGETPNNEEQAQTSTDQVQGQDVKVGEGAEASPGSQVSVLYEGRLQDGTVFDSSAAHNNEPLVFVLGAQGLISGFQVGVNGMKVGGERMILVPPALGYGVQEVKGADGKVIIPANSSLIFSLKLVKVETPSAPIAP